MRYVCDGIAIEAGVCEETEYGTFIGRLSEASYPIMTRAVHIAQFPEPVAFSVTRHSGWEIAFFVFHDVWRPGSSYCDDNILLWHKRKQIKGRLLSCSYDRFLYRYHPVSRCMGQSNTYQPAFLQICQP